MHRARAAGCCFTRRIRAGIVPVAVELREWRPLVSPTNASMLRHVSNHAVGRGQRIQSVDETRHVAVAADPLKVLLRLHQRARHPALNRVAATPALHVPRVALHAAVQVLDDVRRAQSTLQRPRQAEALHGQRLVESLPDGRRRARVVTLQGPRQPLQHPRHRGQRVLVQRVACRGPFRSSPAGLRRRRSAPAAAAPRPAARRAPPDCPRSRRARCHRSPNNPQFWSPKTPHLDN